MKLKHLECAAFIYNDNYINFSNYAKAFAKKKKYYAKSRIHFYLPRFILYLKNEYLSEG